MISMSKISNTFRKFKYKVKHDFSSIENVVLILAIFLCLIWTYQSIEAMSRNWELSERLTVEKKNLELVSIEAQAKELENEYYKSDEYQELMARRNLDKKYSDENMVVMPENSDEAKNMFLPIVVESEKNEHSNVEKWFMYLFPNY